LGASLIVVSIVFPNEHKGVTQSALNNVYKTDVISLNLHFLSLPPLIVIYIKNDTNFLQIGL
jgi:dihydroorotase